MTGRHLQLRMHQKQFVGGDSPGPAGQLTAFPILSRWILGRDQRDGEKRGNRQRGRTENGRGRKEGRGKRQRFIPVLLFSPLPVLHFEKPRLSSNLAYCDVGSHKPFGSRLPIQSLNANATKQPTYIVFFIVSTMGILHSSNEMCLQ